MRELIKALKEQGYQIIELDDGIRIFNRNGYALLYIDTVDRLVVFEQDTWDRNFEVMEWVGKFMDRELD